MGEFFGAIFKNFFGYDIIILLAAVFTGYIYYRLKDSTDKLWGKMTHTVYVPKLDKSRREVDEEISSLKLEEVISLNRKMESFYSVFVNMTAIFPLLGILGTVISLLNLASDMENITGNFYAALTSTFWGLIFAIAFKFIDGLISPDIEYNEKSVELFFESGGDNKKPDNTEADIGTSIAENNTPVEEETSISDEAMSIDIRKPEVSAVNTEDDEEWK